MGMELTPAIQGLFTKVKGIRATYDTLDTRLTTARAALLDNLVNLIGPTALQKYLGTKGDPVATAPLAANTTAWSELQRLEQIICDIEKQVGSLNSGPISSGGLVFNAQTLGPDNADPAYNLFYANGPTNQAIHVDPMAAMGPLVANTGGGGTMTAFTGNPNVANDAVYVAAPISTGFINNFQINRPTSQNPATPATPTPNLVAAGLTSCTGTLAGGVEIIINGGAIAMAFANSGSSSVAYPWLFSVRGATTGPMIGLKVVVTVPGVTNPGYPDFTYFLTGSNGSVSNDAQISLWPGPDMQLGLPHHLLWIPSGPGAGVTFSAAGSFVGQAFLPQSTLPDFTTQLNFRVDPRAFISLGQVRYI